MVPPEDLKTLDTLLIALKANDKVQVAKLIKYPLRRLQPLPPIKNEQEFIENFAQFFDEKNIKHIESSRSEVFNNWQGTEAGGVWIESGKIIVLHTATDQQDKAAEEAKKKVQSDLHPSVRKYFDVMFECRTKSHHIRIHRHLETPDKYTYISWKNGKPLSSKPAIILSGDYEAAGTSGGGLYRFKSADVHYEVLHTTLCGEDCNSYLTVKKGEKMLLKEVCTPVE